MEAMQIGGLNHELKKYKETNLMGVKGLGGRLRDLNNDITALIGGDGGGGVGSDGGC
jgi:hypothetical protein